MLTADQQTRLYPIILGIALVMVIFLAMRCVTLTRELDTTNGQYAASILQLENNLSHDIHSIRDSFPMNTNTDVPDDEIQKLRSLGINFFEAKGDGTYHIRLDQTIDPLHDDCEYIYADHETFNDPQKVSDIERNYNSSLGHQSNLDDPSASGSELTLYHLSPINPSFAKICHPRVSAWHDVSYDIALASFVVLVALIVVYLPALVVIRAYLTVKHGRKRHPDKSP